MTFFVLFVPFVVKKIEPRKARKTRKCHRTDRHCGLDAKSPAICSTCKWQGIPAYQGNDGLGAGDRGRSPLRGNNVQPFSLKDFVCSAYNYELAILSNLIANRTNLFVLYFPERNHTNHYAPQRFYRQNE
jgi:hypothetical protein